MKRRRKNGVITEGCRMRKDRRRCVSVDVCIQHYSATTSNFTLKIQIILNVGKRYHRVAY